MKLKRIAGSAAVSIGRGSGLLAYFESRMRRGLTILTYHRVLPDEVIAQYPLPQLAVSKSIFTSQLEVVATRCRVVTIEEGIRAVERREPMPRPMVAITFDDGYEDNREIAAPVLHRFGVKAMFFIVAGFMGTSRDLWFDRAARVHGRAEGSVPMASWLNQLKAMSPADREALLARADDPGPPPALAPFARIMSREAVRELLAAGHEVGCHTMTHPILTGLSDGDLRAEVDGSRRALAEVSGRSVDVFCYPGGACDARVTRAVADAGFTLAVSTRPGCNYTGCDRFGLARRDAGVRRVRSIRGGLNRTAWRAEVCGLAPALADLASKIRPRARLPGATA